PDDAAHSAEHGCRFSGADSHGCAVGKYQRLLQAVRAALAAAMMLLAQSASAQVTVESFNSASCNVNGTCTSPLTVSLTVTSAQGLIVFASYGCSGSQTAPSVSGITFDTTQTLTQIKHQSGSAAKFMDMWALLGAAPHAGTHNVSITYSSTPDCDTGG